MPSEIDTSSGGGIAARLAKLQLQQQTDSSKINPTSGRERPTPPARRFNTSDIPLIAPRPLTHTPSPSVLHSEGGANVLAKKPPPPLPTRRTNSLPKEAAEIAPALPPPPPPPPAHTNTNSSLDTPQVPTRKPSNGSVNLQNSRPIPSPPARPPIPLPVRHQDNKSQSEPKVFKILAPETPPPALPPRLPPRRPTSGVEIQATHPAPANSHHQHNPLVPTSPLRRLPPPPSEAPRLPDPLPIRHHQHTAPPTPPPVPSRPAFTACPPPIPSTARPALPPTRPAPPITPPNTSPVSLSTCLVCRDFSHPDTIAASPHLLRQNVTSLEWLAHELCSPFPHSTIDKARAVFTWLHHNIAYDAVGLANNTPFRGTPLQTIQSGLSVCQGYAEVFEILCIMGGVPSGQVKVVSGCGKGAGYKPMKPGDPIPPVRQGHAWNAIYFPEEGFQRWHLVDPCWGAGNVSGTRYNKVFNPRMFSQTPAEFGRRHYPEDPRWQCNDGQIMSWEFFITMELREGPQVTQYTPLKELGFDKARCTPLEDQIGNAYIQERGGKVTFSIGKACPHMRINMQEEYVYILIIDGAGQNFALEPPSPRAELYSWESVTWSVTLDFYNHPRLRGLDMDGRKIQVMYVTKFDQRDAKGLSVQQWKEKDGRVAQGYSGICCWNNSK